MSDPNQKSAPPPRTFADEAYVDVRAEKPAPGVIINEQGPNYAPLSGEKVEEYMARRRFNDVAVVALGKGRFAHADTDGDFNLSVDEARAMLANPDIVKAMGEKRTQEMREDVRACEKIEGLPVLTREEILNVMQLTQRYKDENSGMEYDLNSRNPLFNPAKDLTKDNRISRGEFEFAEARMEEQFAVQKLPIDARHPTYPNPKVFSK